MARGRPRRIGILTFDGAEILDVAGPLGVFATANDVRAGSRARAPAYEIVLLAPRAGRIRTGAGVEMGPVRSFRRCGRLDTLLIAGGSDAGVRAALGTPGLAPWLRTMARATRRVGSVCTGAFVLAAAGLLDGRRATTHWNALDRLRDAHPSVEVEPDALYVRDGRVFTAAGVTAGMDLALALVEEDLGRRMAMAVARYLVVFLKRPGGQTQFSGHLAAQAARTDRFDELLAWISEHPAADLSVPALARRAAMSERHFARSFRDQLGVTPARFVERLRLDYARRLLEESDEPLKRIADVAGFGTPETLRRTLSRHLRVTPDAYRARFARRAAGAPPSRRRATVAAPTHYSSGP
jgi:transcriptional regulator GlxA family with amidase domain